MGDFYKFPEIKTLDRCPEVFLIGSVVVTEKIHGTNVRFGLVDGQFTIGGRNQTFSSPKDDGYGFYSWLAPTDVAERMRAKGYDNTIVYGEWYGPHVQKGIVYATEKQFRGFAVRMGLGFLPIKDAFEVIVGLGLQTVPILYEGAPNQKVFDLFRDFHSVTALANSDAGQALSVNLWQNTAEGVVIWPTYPFQDRYGDWVIAKHKNTKWSEKKVPATDSYTASTSAQAFVDTYATAQRLEHVLQHLYIAKVDVVAPHSISKILREFSDDMIRESGEDFTKLSKDEQKAVTKLAARIGKQLLDQVDFTDYQKMPHQAFAQAA